MAENRVFLPPPLAEGATIELGSEVFRHLMQVLRMKPGARFMAFDGGGDEFEATLSEVSKRTATATIGRRIAVNRESPLEIVLAQVIGKGERMDWAIQKAVEVGVSRVVPLLSERCNVSLDADRQSKRLEHWRGVIISACEQSGRTRIPELSGITSFDEWLSMDGAPVRLVLDGSGGSLVEALSSRPKSLSLCVGPEGGFTRAETERAAAYGASVVRLGPRVIRTETAGVAAIAVVQSLLGDWT